MMLVGTSKLVDKPLLLLSAPAISATHYAAPSGETLGRMLPHPFGKLRRAHQAGLHRHIGEVRRGDGLLMTIGRRGEAAQHGDDADHDRKAPS